MTVGDLRQILESIPDNFQLIIASQPKSEYDESIIKTVNIDRGRLVLRDHVLSIERAVQTFTAFDGSEYTLTVSRVSNEMRIFPGGSA